MWSIHTLEPTQRRSSLPDLFWLVFLGALLLGGSRLQAAEPKAELFEQYDVVLGHAQDQTVLAGFFLGGPMADLAAVHVDSTGNRRLRLFEFTESTWEPRLEADLGSEVAFVDVARVDERDQLIVFTSRGFSWFDPTTPMVRPLVELTVNYKATHDFEGSPSKAGSKPPWVDVTHDLNGDGRDDLVVPDLDGFWVSIQKGDGSFSETVKVGPAEPLLDQSVGNLDPGRERSGAARTYRDVGITASTIPMYLSRIHQVDYDRDGLIDLLFWNKDRFDVHLQEEDGQFAHEAESFASQVEIDSEGAYSHSFAYSDRSVFSTMFGLGKKATRTVLYSVRDLNGDGVADLMTLTLSGRSIIRQRSVYEVYYGKSTADGLMLGPEPDDTLRPRGRAGAMQPFGYSSQWLRDFDGDGQVDILFRDVAVGLGGMMRAMVGKSVGINLELYRMRDGRYPAEPTATRKLRRFAPFSGFSNVFFPPVVAGDVNGDGISDLVVGKGPRELRVLFGQSGPSVFAAEPPRVSVRLPADERRVHLVDLNGDGKDDLLIHVTPTDREPELSHRVTALIAL